MSERTEIDARMAVTEDKEMDQKGSELRGGGLTDQMTVTMTNKDPAWSTPCKGENKEVALSELGSSPTGSFQSLQSSQSSEGGSGMFTDASVCSISNVIDERKMNISADKEYLSDHRCERKIWLSHVNNLVTSG